MLTPPVLKLLLFFPYCLLKQLNSYHGNVDIDGRQRSRSKVILSFLYLHP